MNTLIEQMYSTRHNYCHVIEVSDVYEMEEITNQIMLEAEEQHGRAAVIEFLESLEVHCTDDDNEAEIYAFSFKDYIDANL